MLKNRRGSIILVIVFATIMAMVMLTFMHLAQSLTTGSKDSAKVYADIQSYRSASELMCYQYITDLTSLSVTRDLDAEWLSVTNRAIYTQAIETLLNYGTIADPSYGNADGVMWIKHDILDALSTVHVTNGEFVDDITSHIENGLEYFSLTVPEPLIVDPMSEKSYEQVRKAYLELKPFIIDIDMRIKGEKMHDSYVVTDMFLLVTQENVYLDADHTTFHAIATLSIVEAEEGCHIYRDRG